MWQNWDSISPVLAHYGTWIPLCYLNNCGCIWQTFSDVVYGKEIRMFSFKWYSQSIWHKVITGILTAKMADIFLQHNEIGLGDGDLYQAKYTSKLVFDLAIGPVYPGRFGPNFRHVISSHILVVNTISIFSVSKPTLVHVRAWCHQAPSHYMNQCSLSCMIPYGITRAQRVNLTTTEYLQNIHMI